MEFDAFGEVELSRIVSNLDCVFICYTDISSAIRALETMKNDQRYVFLRFGYGRDRCAARVVPQAERYLLTPPGTPPY
jgi:hypothetical protein